MKEKDDVERKILLTGGAGFIGSHLFDRLVALNHDVTILDNLSSGSKENLILQPRTGPHARARRLIFGDCTDSSIVQKAIKGVDIVLHLAANSDVRLERNDPETCFNQNIYATYIILEAMRRSSAHTIVYTSSSTVYGDANTIPTPEDHPTRPISIYGASKLASEALITSYAYTYDLKAIILRLANIVGPRSRHGVLHDFRTKLEYDPTMLEVLGDSTQAKSYLHIDDCINAILLSLERAAEHVSILNVGSEDQLTVKEIGARCRSDRPQKRCLYVYRWRRWWQRLERRCKNHALRRTSDKGLGLEMRVYECRSRETHGYGIS